MIVPEPPVLIQLERITPSVYEASIHCLAKAAWLACGDASVMPQHPAAILGTAFHVVVAVAHKGELQVAAVDDCSPARELFDKTTQKLHLDAHPLVKLKYSSADRLPFYNLNRERAALVATSIAASRPPSARSGVGTTKSGSAAVRTEPRLRSRDGRLVGRADYIDGQTGVVVDYKTGYSDACAVSDSEARQLRLYAYLAAENGTDIGTGAVVRGDGQRCEIAISPAEAAAEANSATNQLDRLNSAASVRASFRDVASPSPSNCSSCPCLPFCGPFWSEAGPDWAVDGGAHVEGSIAEIDSQQIQGISLTTLVLAKQAGTVSAKQVSIEQIPTAWLTTDGLDLPRIGDAIRVVHGRQTKTDKDGAVIRVDKALTAVWQLRDGDAGSDRR